MCPGVLEEGTHKFAVWSLPLCHSDSWAFWEPWRPPIPANPQAMGHTSVVSSSVVCILTIVGIGHCLPHGEDHGQDERRVTKLLVVWGGETGGQNPKDGRNPSQWLDTLPPHLTLRVCLHVPGQLHRQHGRHQRGDDGCIKAAHGPKAFEEQQAQ